MIQTEPREHKEDGRSRCPVGGLYLSEIKAGNWLTALPIKTLRYIVKLGVGTLNPIAGGVVSAIDTFLLEKVFGGWKPNHFVEKRLLPFLDTDRKP